METRAALTKKATGIVRKVGWARFSYADLSSAVGIRKASIHHHFPNKTDLGVAIVEEYRATFARELAEIEASERSSARRLRRYALLYRMGLTDGNGCLCGVLAAESGDLPVPMNVAVRGFFDENVAWLERMIAEPRRRGGIKSNAARTRQQAHLVLATLQGAMLIARAQNDVAMFDAAADAVIENVCE